MLESFFICWFSLPLSFAHTWLTGCSHTDRWSSYKKDRKTVEKYEHKKYQNNVVEMVLA